VITTTTGAVLPSGFGESSDTGFPRAAEFSSTQDAGTMSEVRPVSAPILYLYSSMLAVLVARDLLLLCLLPSLRRSGRVALPVNLVGKAGTMFLLLAFPLMLIGSSASFGLVAAGWLGWILALSGAVAYWVAGVLYLRGTVELARERGERDAS